MQAFGRDQVGGMTSRGAVGAGVIALHLLALWAFIAAGRLQLQRAAVEPVMTWLSFPDAATRTRATQPDVRPATPARARGRLAEPTRLAGQPAPIVSVSPDLPRSTAITPQAVERQPAVDWSAAAVDAARHHLDEEASDRRRDHAMGEAPEIAARARAPHPAFPWGHQPMGKHFDVQGPVLLVRTKRCVFGVLVVLPGFSCNPGRIDPEPGQGDLFDPKYAPQPLELPRPLVDDPLAPGGRGATGGR